MISYNETKSDKTFKCHIWESLSINHNSFSTKVINRFLICSMPSSYKSNITRALKQTYFTNYIPIRKIKAVHRQELEQRNI